jgi:hypothetical protein
MFNERVRHIQQRIVAGTWHSYNARFSSRAPEEMMSGAMIAFGIGLGAATLICYRMLMRLPKRRVINGPSTEGSGTAGGNDAGDSASHFAWSTAENSAAHHFSSASDSGGAGDSVGGDGGGGSDGGGGGDGGGGSD